MSTLYDSEAEAAVAALASDRSLADDAIGAAFTNLELRTAYTPPVILTPQDISQGGMQPNLAQSIYTLKPTVILRSRVFGNKTIAPGGAVRADEWKANAWKVALITGGGFFAFAGGLFGLGIVFGKWLERRKKRG